MNKSRKPMHVDICFEERMKQLQKKIRKKQGENISLRELTKQIPKFEEFEIIEDKILNIAIKGNEDGIFNINFDRRRR
jgi:hypothetical protein